MHSDTDFSHSRLTIVRDGFTNTELHILSTDERHRLQHVYADNRRRTELPLTNNVFALCPFQTPDASIA